LAGRRIAVQGTVEGIAVFCPQAVYPPDNPDRNACSYRMGFRLAEHRSISFSGIYGGCSGNACRTDARDLEPGKIYRATGIMQNPEGFEINFQWEQWNPVG
jgi:hypothetical protein